MSPLGYAKIHREIWEHWLWKKKPFSPAQAWIDMVLLANYKTNKVPYRNQITEIGRGEFIRSRRDLAKRWGWNDSAVQRFLVLLENDSMIVRKVNQKANHITICNYDKWQNIGTNNEPIMNHERTNREPIANINNKDKKVKKEKKYIIPYLGSFQNVKLLEEETGKLKEDFGELGADERIERLSTYMASKGDKYKSHYATILSWARKEPNYGHKKDDSGYVNEFLKDISEGD